MAKRIDTLLERRQPMLSRQNLHLGHERLQDAELEAILADERVPALRILDLGSNQLTAAAVDTTLGSPKTRDLHWLILSNNPIGDTGLEHLAAAKSLGSVTYLSVVGVRATARGVRALAQGDLPSVKTLQIGWQELGTEGAHALLTLPQLEKLDVMHSQIAAEGARALIAGSRAEVLILAENPIGAGGLAGLRAVSPDLRTLDVSKTGIDAGDIAVLTGLDANIERLRLSYCPIGDEGLAHLARAPWLGQLVSLDVGGVQSSPAGRSVLRNAWGQRRGLTIKEDAPASRDTERNGTSPSQP